VGQRHHAGRELDALRALAGRREEHLGGADHLPAARVVLAAPELVVAEVVQVLHEVHVPAELQHRVLADRVVGGEERAEAQTWHGQASWWWWWIDGPRPTGTAHRPLPGPPTLPSVDGPRAPHRRPCPRSVHYHDSGPLVPRDPMTVARAMAIVCALVGL